MVVKWREWWDRNWLAVGIFTCFLLVGLAGVAITRGSRQPAKAIGSLSYYEATLLLDAEVDRLQYLRERLNAQPAGAPIAEADYSELEQRFEEQARRVVAVSLARRAAATREGLE